MVSLPGGAKSWSLGSHALRVPLACGKELDPEPCTGTAAAVAAECSWCLGTFMHRPSLRGDKHRVRIWWGRTSTRNTSRRGQERRDALLSPDPQAWELGTPPNPGPGPLCLHARLCTGMVWSGWHPSGCPGLMHHLSTEARATGAKHSCTISVSLPTPRHPFHTEAVAGHQPSPPTSLAPLKTGWPPAQHSSGWLQAPLEGHGWK